MANTGFKQSVIVYRVDATTGQPLDTNGNLIVVDGVPTGRKQAIALLTGTANPNPSLYDVQFYFAVDAVIEGTPTTEISDDCPVGFIFLTPMPSGNVVLTTAAPSLTLTVTSSGPWVSSVPSGVLVVPNNGPRDETSITISRNGTGQGLLVFTNTTTGQTVSVYVVSVDSLVWILETHAWNMNGVWIDSSVWGA